MNNNFIKKAWILDTDLGWDPDDIIALLLLIEYLKINNFQDKIAIISSDETENYDRSYVIKEIVDILLPNNNVCVAHGIYFNKNKNAKKISDDLIKYINLEKNIGNIYDIADFITNSKKELYHVTWIGIGAMTNLNWLINKNIKPDNIIQMGGTLFDEVEYNINLDPIACKQVLEKWNNPNTLEFILLDTTGYKLNWLNETLNDDKSLLNRLNEDFLEIILNKYPKIFDILEANTNYYTFDSSLHDPLTIMYAIDSSILKTYKTKLISDNEGKWYAQISNQIIDSFNENKQLSWWWENTNEFIRDKTKEPIKDYNCKISLGPLDDEQVNYFIDKIFTIL